MSYLPAAAVEAVAGAAAGARAAADASGSARPCRRRRRLLPTRSAPADTAVAGAAANIDGTAAGAAAAAPRFRLRGGRWGGCGKRCEPGRGWGGGGKAAPVTRACWRRRQRPPPWRPCARGANPNMPAPCTRSSDPASPLPPTSSHLLTCPTASLCCWWHRRGAEHGAPGQSLHVTPAAVLATASLALPPHHPTADGELTTPTPRPLRRWGLCS